MDTTKFFVVYVGGMATATAVLMALGLDFAVAISLVSMAVNIHTYRKASRPRCTTTKD